MNSPVMGTRVPAVSPVPTEPPSASQGRDRDLWARGVMAQSLTTLPQRLISCSIKYKTLKQAIPYSSQLPGSPPLDLSLPWRVPTWKQRKLGFPAPVSRVSAGFETGKALGKTGAFHWPLAYS